MAAWSHGRLFWSQSERTLRQLQLVGAGLVERLVGRSIDYIARIQNLVVFSKHVARKEAKNEDGVSEALFLTNMTETTHNWHDTRDTIEFKTAMVQW